MEQIHKILDSIVMPDPEFIMVERFDHRISFEATHKLQVPDANDELSKLVFAQVQRNHISASDIDRQRIISYVTSSIREFHIKVWLKVNKKTNWNRTKLRKSIGYANSDRFKNNTLELFLDAGKFGITADTLDASEIKPIHKFIAAKFEAMVEAECPR